MSLLKYKTDEVVSILIVDDEPTQRESLMQVITFYGYQVKSVGSGEEAVRLLKNQSFDILLLDLMMPGLNGFGVIDYVISNKLPSKIVVISGDASFDTAKQALKQGAHDFVKKPYLIDELLNTIKNTASKKVLEDDNKIICQKLTESEYFHRFIVDHSPDIIFMLDTQGCFTFLNDTITDALGYEKTDLLGQHYSKIVSVNSLEKADHVFAECSSEKRVYQNVELKLKCLSDSEYCYFDISSMSVMLNQTVDNEEEQFKGIYCVARDITEKKQTQELIKFQAYHDLLTKLPNRALMEDRLKTAITHAKRINEQVAFMFLDLDRFKLINDTLGHTMGDKLLQSVSLRLKECLRKGDTLARFGGDEFAIILPQVKQRNNAETIAKKVLNLLKAPFYIEGHELHISGSIGIALYPEGGEDMETLIQNADLAMYSVKEGGKNDFEFFNKEMNVMSSARLTIERDLRKALANGDLSVCYQPQVNAQTEKIVGFEALVRWKHTEKGMIFPDEFIPVAEETGLILDIGELVLDTACKDLASWRNAGVDNIQVSINFSARQIDQDDFIDSVINALNYYNLPYHCLIVEITENIIMNNISRVIRRLRQLAAYGVKIAVDDFGTGYSSLSYLQHFPIDTLKIDKSFVNSINESQGSTSIVNAIVAMAKGLELQLVAEGVETDPQLEHLKNQGCPIIQGWLFGKAESALTTKRLLDKIDKGGLIRDFVEV